MPTMKTETLRLSDLTDAERARLGFARLTPLASTTRQGAQARSLNARKRKVSLAPVAAFSEDSPADE